MDRGRERDEQNGRGPADAGPHREPADSAAKPTALRQPAGWPRLLPSRIPDDGALHPDQPVGKRTAIEDAMAGAAPGGAEPTLDRLEAELGDGQPLSGRESELARRVGADPASARVHRGAAASEAAARRGAAAFAAGDHIVMGSSAPAAGSHDGDHILAHEAAHVAQQQQAARDPAQRRQPIGREELAAENDAAQVASAALVGSANERPGVRTEVQIQRWPQLAPQETPKDIASKSLNEKAAFITKSMTDGEEGWGRVVVDVFEQTAPAMRVALQRQLDMQKLVSALPDFEATRLGTLGPLTAGQATLNDKRAAYIGQVINDFGDRADVFVLFALRGVYDDDAYALFEKLANRRYLHKVLAMPEVAKQIKDRGLKVDGFQEPDAGFLGGVGGVLGGLGAGMKHAVKDDRPGKYSWQKAQLPPEYAEALSQMEMAELGGDLTAKNIIIGAIDQVTFGVPHGVVDLGRDTVNAVRDIGRGEYRAAGEELTGAAVVLLTHLGVKAWRAIRSTKPTTPSATKPAEDGGVKGPEGPGQFVIPNFEGPISPEEAKLGAIFELNPEAQAAMGRLIARIGRGGVAKVASFVQANSRAALFIAEHGEPGVYALLEADGDAALAETKLPKRQLGPGTTDTAVRVERPGNHPELLKQLDSKAKIDPKYTKDPRFDSLASDPDHAGATSPNSLQEAMAGLEAESRGLLPGPISRGPEGIEFYDAEGHPWDVKKPPSPSSGAPWRFSVRKVATAIQQQVRLQFINKITKQPEPIRVLLDSSYMNPADHAALWRALRGELSPEELALITELNTIP